MRHEDAVRRLPDLVGLRAAAADDTELSAHVEGCERCQARLRRLRDVDAGLRSLEAQPPPSARLERRILAIPGAGAPEARRPRSRRWALAVAACAVLVLGSVAGVLATRVGGDGAFEAQRSVQLATQGAPGVSALVEIGAEDGSRIPVRIVATGLPHGGDRYYGLWLTGADGSVSGGSFMPDGAGRCVVMLQVPAGTWTAVDITAGDRPPSARTTVASADL